MKNLFIATGLSLAVSAFAADVGVSIQISQPGVYGRIDIGRFPQPQVIVAQPVLVQGPAIALQRAEPVYLWVPPGHRKNWKKHCRDYGACGVPVYFVRDDWYDRHVRSPKHGKDRHEDRGHGKGKDKHDKNGKDKPD